MNQRRQERREGSIYKKKEYYQEIQEGLIVLLLQGSLVIQANQYLPQNLSYQGSLGIQADQVHPKTCIKIKLKYLHYLNYITQYYLQSFYYMSGTLLSSLHKLLHYHHDSPLIQALLSPFISDKTEFREIKCLRSLASSQIGICIGVHQTPEFIQYFHDMQMNYPH